MNTTSRPVLVGVDGHVHSRLALEHAVAEAVHRGRELRIVHAVPVTVGGVYVLPVLEHQEEVAEQVLREAVDRVRELAPDLPVTTTHPVGDAAACLVHESQHADLVVVGARGRGAAASAFLGSTSLYVAGHAYCPVAVVRHLPPPDTTTRGIVVGADGSATGDAALGEAFRLADERDLHLSVVHASTLASVETQLTIIDSPDLRERVLDEERLVMDRAVGAWQEKYPDVEVDTRIVDDHPVQALLEAAEGAVLLVVGSRGRGGFAGLVLGSVGQGVLHGASCPVLVVRPERR